MDLRSLSLIKHYKIIKCMVVSYNWCKVCLWNTIKKIIDFNRTSLKLFPSQRNYFKPFKDKLPVFIHDLIEIFSRWKFPSWTPFSFIQTYIQKSENHKVIKEIQLNSFVLVMFCKFTVTNNDTDSRRQKYSNLTIKLPEWNCDLVPVSLSLLRKMTEKNNS